MQIQQRKISELIPYINNSRTHSDSQVSQIAASIKEFGFTNPILVDGENGIIAGHGRVMAAKKLGMEEVPTIELSHLSGPQRRAYIIADNGLALNAGWDDELLRVEIDELELSGFDIDLLGFASDELSKILGLDEELDGEAPPDAGIEYKENFAIIVACSDEADQQKTYERLETMGFSCKVLVN